MSTDQIDIDAAVRQLRFEFENVGGTCSTWARVEDVRQRALTYAVKLLAYGFVLLEHSPGNGTRYTIAVTDLHRLTQYPHNDTGGRWLISKVEGHSFAIVTNVYDLLHPSYLLEHTSIGVGDAYPLAEFLTLLFTEFRALEESARIASANLEETRD